MMYQLNTESIKRVARFPTPMSDQVATEMALLAFPGFKLSKAKVLQKIDLSEKEVEDTSRIGKRNSCSKCKFAKKQKSLRVSVSFQKSFRRLFPRITLFPTLDSFHPDLDVVSTSTEDFGSDLWVGWPVAFLTFADTIAPTCSTWSRAQLVVFCLAVVEFCPMP